MNIAIFASGAGSNAAEIIKKLHIFIHSSEGCIRLILTNNKNAGVLQIAASHNIPTEVIDLKQKTDSEAFITYQEVLQKHTIDFIVLAGYLKKIPAELIKLYPQKIINIHPALLPAYGGAGMYGARVHEAVIASKEKESGITIHFVDEIYDNGKIIFQAKCALSENETALSLAKKVQALEYENYTRVIGEVLIR
jgi:phosphoribosylglycinamide formyltransferase 1